MVTLCQIHPELEMLVLLLTVHIELETSQHMFDTKSTQRLVWRTLHNLKACQVNHHFHTLQGWYQIRVDFYDSCYLWFWFLHDSSCSQNNKLRSFPLRHLLSCGDIRTHHRKHTSAALFVALSAVNHLCSGMCCHHHLRPRSELGRLRVNKVARNKRGRW